MPQGMRALNGAQRRMWVMEQVSNDIVSMGGQPLNTWLKPIQISDESGVQNSMRHICDPNLGVLHLPLTVYSVPLYVDTYTGEPIPDGGYMDYNVYFCPHCGKVYLYKDDTF